ncbi:MAG: hypothetical protein NZM11_04755 [Anaerolineales bacterium]|nr:hypothetical protein [Anaerolineales bacterium]
MSWLKTNWLPVIIAACVLVTLVYVALWQTAARPVDGGSLAYPLMVFYNHTVLPASILVMLAALTALFFWIPNALVKRGPYRRDGLLVLVGLAATVAVIAAAVPLGRLIYRELASVSAHGRSYHLGVLASSMPEQNAIVLCAGGFITQCRYLPDESTRTFNPLPTLALDPGTQVVTVRVGERILYEAGP